MKLNLRKAHALTNTLVEYMFNLGTTVPNFSVDDTVDVAAVISEKTSEFHKNLDSYMAAQDILFSIRHKIAEANQGEINNLVHRLAALDARIKLLSGIVSVEPRDEDKVILARVEKIKTGTLVGAKQSLYGQQEIQTSVKVSPLTKAAKEEMSQSLANLRLEKTSLKQDLLEENIKKSITLDEAEVSFLQAATLLSK